MSKKFIATEPLYVGRYRAANPGDEIPEDNVRAQGWEDKVEIVDTDEPEPESDNVKDILARVGDDPAKAQEALTAEQAKEQPRPTLVEKLQSITGTSD